MYLLQINLYSSTIHYYYVNDKKFIWNLSDLLITHKMINAIKV